MATILHAIAETMATASAVAFVVCVACGVCRALNWAPVNLTVNLYHKPPTREE